MKWIHRILVLWGTFVINSATHLSYLSKLQTRHLFTLACNPKAGIPCFWQGLKNSFPLFGYIDLNSVCSLNKLLRLFRGYRNVAWWSKPAAPHDYKTRTLSVDITYPLSSIFRSVARQFKNHWVYRSWIISFIPPLFTSGLGTGIGRVNEDHYNYSCFKC